MFLLQINSTAVKFTLETAAYSVEVYRTKVLKEPVDPYGTWNSLNLFNSLRKVNAAGAL